MTETFHSSSIELYGQTGLLYREFTGNNALFLPFRDLDMACPYAFYVGEGNAPLYSMDTNSGRTGFYSTHMDLDMSVNVFFDDHQFSQMQFFVRTESFVENEPVLIGFVCDSDGLAFDAFNKGKYIDGAAVPNYTAHHETNLWEIRFHDTPVLSVTKQDHSYTVHRFSVADYREFDFTAMADDQYTVARLLQTPHLSKKQLSQLFIAGSNIYDVLQGK